MLEQNNNFYIKSNKVYKTYTANSFIAKKFIGKNNSNILKFLQQHENY